jgi:hypothetical protein
MKASNIPELKGGQMITLLYFIGIVIILFIVIKLLQKFGLIKTAAQKRTETEQTAATEMLRTDDYFSPDYYKGRNFKSLGTNSANEYATSIHDSIYGFLKVNTNAEPILTTFGKLYNKCNVSEVSAFYNLQYGRDMQADLLNNLNKGHITDLMNIVNGLPNS